MENEPLTDADFEPNDEIPEERPRITQSPEKKQAEIEEKKRNLALTLAEDTANFLQPAQSSDAELVKAAVEFSMEMSPEQNKVLVQYEMLSVDPKVNAEARSKLKIIILAFKTRQKYFNTKAYIMDIINSLSWRTFVQTGAVSGSVNKSESTMK